MLASAKASGMIAPRSSASSFGSPSVPRQRKRCPSVKVSKRPTFSQAYEVRGLPWASQMYSLSQGRPSGTPSPERSPPTLDVSIAMHWAGCCAWWMQTHAMRVPTATRASAIVRQRAKVPAAATTVIMKIALSPTASQATVRPARPRRLTVTRKHQAMNADSQGT